MSVHRTTLPDAHNTHIFPWSIRDSWIFGPRFVVEVVFNGLWPRELSYRSRGVEEALMGKVRTASTHWNIPGEYVPHGELFFMLMKKRADGLQ